ncbi:hypothetical protein UY3_10260 [Chelonia mydas]|uniref:Uncharacterized protein n=1 Tax=Chelonia mydas TaxID=8469 RepID=M7B648_CHEMY|nr:hypothetical protein UY3_10260 [Chelonia mydas]
MQGTEFSRMKWKCINFMEKLVQIQTDIIFLSKCKHMDIIPKGVKCYKKDSSWTPPNGQNNRLDFYIECFRRCARAEIVERQHHLPHNLSQGHP